jgi:erythromycin esterase-like protein
MRAVKEMISARSAKELGQVIRAEALELNRESEDYQALLDLIGESRFVLLGEASHGTHDFYQVRADITKRLIREKDFVAVAVEADWPDAYRVNRYVRGLSNAQNANEALQGFKRFPTWMWRNTVVLEFVEWLKQHNDRLSADKPKTGFYGLDLYSLNASIEAVLGYLAKVDPEAAKRARYRYSCFDHFGDDAQAYGYAASFGLSESCEREVLSQLAELRRKAAEYANRDGRVAQEEFFFAEQNARLVKNAEEYYRTMFRGHIESWNKRDTHMMETLENLAAYFAGLGQREKIVVWAHNSHLGDARATDIGQGGELNVGQLIKARYGKDAVLVGFTTNTGTVTAASDWGSPAERKWVRPALRDSYESVFHQVQMSAFQLNLRDEGKAREALRVPHLERAIGVIYRPESERLSHYFNARLSDQFDAVLHFDETQALEPLERTAGWESGEFPETFPWGV